MLSTSHTPYNEGYKSVKPERAYSKNELMRAACELAWLLHIE